MEICFKGNNGGDYIRIKQSKKQEKESCLDLEVGHCCVVILKSQVPVEFLTSLICQFMLVNSDGMSRYSSDRLSDFAKEVLVYQDEKFVQNRLSKIK